MKSTVAAALAAAGLAQAILLPPEVSKADVAAAEAVAEQFSPVTSLGLAGTERQTLYLDCPGCPVPVLGKYGEIEGLAVQPNHLELVFHVDHKDGQPDSLMLNDLELYPTLNPDQPFLVAAQLPNEEAQGEKDEDQHGEQDDETPEKVAKKEDGQNNDDLRRRHVNAINRHDRVTTSPRSETNVFPQHLGFGLSVQSPIVSSDKDGLELIRMHLQIIEVGQAFIDGIPGVHIELVKLAESGRLMIAKVEPTQSQTAKPDVPADGQPEAMEPSKDPADFDRCSSHLCRWMVALRAKVQAVAKKPLAMIKGHHCQHHKPAPSASDADAASLSPEEAAALPSHHKVHAHPAGHGHGYDHHSHHKMHIAKGIVAHILLPIMVGIVAGVSVSLIGVVVGTLVISIWRFIRGGSICKRGQCPRLAAQKAARVEAAAEEEKVGLMEYSDIPPQHEAEVPAPPKGVQKADDA